MRVTHKQNLLHYKTTNSDKEYNSLPRKLWIWSMLQLANSVKRTVFMSANLYAPWIMIQLVNGHRIKFYELRETFNGDEHFSVLGTGDVNDDYVLGAHLFSVHNKEINRILIIVFC